MSNLYYAASYKNKIINLLIQNEDFIKLMNPAPSAREDLELMGQIFDYNFLTEDTDDEKTFVVVETNIEAVRNNRFVDFNLYVYIFTAKKLVRLTDSTMPTIQEVKDMGYFADTCANRIDILCDIVDRMLNGTDQLPGIGDTQPASEDYVSVYAPNDRYYGKCLKYKITNYNKGGDVCGD